MDEDEWFFNSFKKYNELQMFDFPKNVFQIDLTSNNNLCVALQEDTGHRNEISIFHLPSSLKHDTFSGFTKIERHLSFHHGYFTESPLVQLKCISQSNNVVISENNGVGLYDIASKESDIIQRISDIPGDFKRALIAVSAVEHSLVLCDAETQHSTVIDYEKMNVVFHLPSFPQEPAQPLFSSVNVVAFGSTFSGSVNAYDLRSGLLTTSFVTNDHIHESNSFPSRWVFNSTFECSREPVDENFLLAWSNNGYILMYDWRNLTEPVQFAKHSVYHQNDDKIFNTMSVSPVNTNQFALCGFDENVYICELKNNAVNTLFIHDGHPYSHDEYEANVMSTGSMWLPCVSANTLISCASNASLQCWQYRIL